MSKQKTIRKRLVNFIEKYELWFYGSAVVLSLIVIPISLLVFPDTTLATFVLVSLSGLLNSVGAFATVLLSADATKEIKNKDE